MCTVKGTVGSNPTLSAINLSFSILKCGVKIDLVALLSQMRGRKLIMFKKIFKFIATRLLVGKLFEQMKPKLPIISILALIIFIVFYGPYEYENYLEFKQKFPDNNLGLFLNLLRPLVVIGLLVGTVSYIFINKKRYEREEAERLAREQAEREREKAELLAKKEAAMKKIEEIGSSSIGKAAGAASSKEGIGAALGGVGGGVVGSSMGIAAFGTAVAATWPFAIAGAAVGWLAVKAYKKSKATKEERERIIKEEQAKIKAYGEKINEDSRNER